MNVVPIIFNQIGYKVRIHVDKRDYHDKVLSIALGINGLNHQALMKQDRRKNQ